MSEAHIYSYTQSLKLSRKTGYSYIWALRRQAWLIAKVARLDPGEAARTVAQAMREESKRRSMKQVAHDFAVLRGFFAWQTRNGRATNPFAELKRWYGPWLTSVFRGSQRTDDEMERAAQFPKHWKSHLGPLMHASLTRGRALGYKLESLERLFWILDRFVQRNPELSTRAILEVTKAWADEVNTPRRRADAYICYRKLALEQHRLDPACPMPKEDPSYWRAASKAERQPTVLSEKEIELLLCTAKNYFRNTRFASIGRTAHAVIAVLCSTGIRVGELGRLTVGDVDFSQCLLQIRDTKFFKSRQVPFTLSLKSILTAYRRQAELIGASNDPQSPFFWSVTRRAGYRGSHMSELVRKVLRLAKLKPLPGRRGPRAHDLRHTFVQHRLLDFYRRGLDPQDYLPYLATYLGHVDIASTMRYIHGDLAILQFASDRFRKSVADVIKVQHLESH